MSSGLIDGLAFIGSSGAADSLIKSSLSYNGQRCTALKIFFVKKEERVRFDKMFKEEVGKLKVGLPWDGKDGGVTSDITPLPEGENLYIYKYHVMLSTEYKTN